MATLQIAQPDVTQVSSFAASLNSLAQDQSKVLFYYLKSLMENCYLFILFVFYCRMWMKRYEFSKIFYTIQ